MMSDVQSMYDTFVRVTAWAGSLTWLGLTQPLNDPHFSLVFLNTAHPTGLLATPACMVQPLELA
jgi:hypothetical protein